MQALFGRLDMHVAGSIEPWIVIGTITWSFFNAAAHLLLLPLC
jgi:hypothetical protein